MTIQNWINWHRTFGFIATLFILTLAITGLMLNHSVALKLDRIYIENEIILDWYGIVPDREPVSFPAGTRRVTQIDKRVYLDEDEIQDNQEELRGAIGTANIVLLAYSNSLCLLTEQGQLIEELGREQGLPGDIRNIGLGRDGEILIRTGNAVLYSDLDMRSWKPYSDTHGYWSEKDKLPETLEKTLIRKYRGKGLSLEKLIMDLHSGMIFGVAGVYMMDLSAIIFIILAVSGWWLWLKRRALQREINGGR